MNLSLNNEKSKTKTLDTEVDSFVKELKNSLTKEKDTTSKNSLDDENVELEKETKKTKTKSKNTKAKEINKSKDELDNTLEKDTPFDTVITNKIYNENPLAVKYKDQLEEIIAECFENMSYEKDFYYFDYDKENDVYYLDEYSKGEITRTEYTKKEFEKSVYTLGSFWRPYGDTKVVEAEYMGEGIEIDVNSELDFLDWKNNKKKEQKKWVIKKKLKNW